MSNLIRKIKINSLTNIEFSDDEKILINYFQNIFKDLKIFNQYENINYMNKNIKLIFSYNSFFSLSSFKIIKYININTFSYNEIYYIIMKYERDEIEDIYRYFIKNHFNIKCDYIYLNPYEIFKTIPKDIEKCYKKEMRNIKFRKMKELIFKKIFNIFIKIYNNLKVFK